MKGQNMLLEIKNHSSLLINRDVGNYLSELITNDCTEIIPQPPFCFS